MPLTSPAPGAIRLSICDLPQVTPLGYCTETTAATVPMQSQVLVYDTTNEVSPAANASLMSWPVSSHSCGKGQPELPSQSLSPVSPPGFPTTRTLIPLGSPVTLVVSFVDEYPEPLTIERLSPICPS